MSISSAALSLLCLGRVMSSACPPANTDLNNHGKCGNKYGRCNPFIETFMPDHEFYALYCDILPGNETGFCHSDEGYEYRNKDSEYDYKPTSCEMPSADQCKADVDECQVACAKVLCECLGAKVGSEDHESQDFCYDDDPTSCSPPLGQTRCYPLPEAHLMDIGDPACLAADDQCMSDCVADQCACDVNRVEVTDLTCEWTITGQWGVFPSARQSRHSALKLFAPGNVLPAPADAASTSSVPASMYALGGLIAALLACIASLLCFAICIRPLVGSMQVAQTKISYGAVDEDENAAL